MYAYAKKHLLQRIKPIHRKFRAEKMEMFLRTMDGDATEPLRLLDVGGGPGVDGEFLGLYSRFGEVVVVNLDRKTFDAPAGVRLQSLVGDGRSLPFASGSFDWVFSNAVIEHVGDWEDQVRFANEVRRVASRGYFVTTPNRYFPLEPHTLIPFYQFLPVSVQQRVAPHSPGYLKSYEPINLLTANQMRTLFPESHVVAMGFPVWGNSLVASYQRSSKSPQSRA